MNSTLGPPITQDFLDEYNGGQLQAVCISFIIIDTFFVAMRYLSRRYQKAPFAWDDVLIVVAWVNLLGVSIDGILSLRWGVGYHMERIVTQTPDKIPDWGRNSFYAFPIMNTCAATWPKLSVLLLFHRIFTDRFSRVCCWIIALILLISALGNVIGCAVQCFPMAKVWNPTLPGYCNNLEAHLIYGGIPNTITDVAMLLLPLPALSKLNVEKHVKVGVIATFLIGLLGLIASIIRLVEYFVNRYASDGTWFATPLFCWAIVESSIYLICACALMFRPLLVRLVHGTGISSLSSWIKRRTNSGTFELVEGTPRGTARSRSGTKGSLPLPIQGAGKDSVMGLAERGEMYHIKFRAAEQA